MTQLLSITNHNRDIIGLTYVYPVLSRRAGGISLGINFNVNNACNWRCVYCQVPNLTRGAPPQLDFLLLEKELTALLDEIACGDFFSRMQVPETLHLIKDIAISGNGEPTAVAEFATALQLIGDIATTKQLLPNVRYVLISNGSLMHQRRVQQGLKVLHEFGGEVWFKIDSATESGRKQINNCVLSQQKLLHHLDITASLCRTKIQTCVVDNAQFRWSERERTAYLHLLERIKVFADIEEVLLYTIARPSQQPEAEQLNAVDPDRLELFAERIRSLGFAVQVSH